MAWSLIASVLLVTVHAGATALNVIVRIPDHAPAT
jgi:hypothetical protein